MASAIEENISTITDVEELMKLPTDLPASLLVIDSCGIVIESRTISVFGSQQQRNMVVRVIKPATPDPINPASTTPVTSDEENRTEDENENDECAICLLPMELPVRLKCNHEFCFGCAKGLANSRNKTCAICRRPISPKFDTQPEKFVTQDVQPPKKEECWFYQDDSGWWAYAPRMQADLDDARKHGKLTYTCMFNGQKCLIDFARSVQTFGCPSVVQEIKRDFNDCSHLGVSGIRYPEEVRPPSSWLSRWSYKDWLLNTSIAPIFVFGLFLLL